MCHNCNDQLLKNISQVIDHVWSKHKIEVVKIWQPVLRAEDARLTKRRTGKKRVSGFRCEECNVSLRNISSLLTHLDKKHGIHIWYEKGLRRKRLFLDGILDDTPTKETKKKQEWVPISTLASKKQREYIELLSSYDSTKEQDKADIKDYLERVEKESVCHLLKKEANELIQILLQRPAEYTFACGKKGTLHKQDVNRYNVFGDFEGCLHACPDGIDVNDCHYWEEHMKGRTRTDRKE